MLPEVEALDRVGSSVRIPPADNVPISPRVRRIIDSAPMRRLASIRQLGMVALVYPGATHSRLEHSLGVYHNALTLVARFRNDPIFSRIVDRTMADAFVLAGLVHDVGHWPFCHPIEDMQLAEFPAHEDRIQNWFTESELGDCIDSDWNCKLADVLTLLQPASYPDRNEPAARLLASCLSGSIDIDKLDYLQRDSLHCGVPYGRNFDAGRLIHSMCINPDTSRLGIGEKGRTAAEMMVFARYVMFSEVYWHHAVRSATAMVQRAVFGLRDQFDFESSLTMTDAPWISMLHELAIGTDHERLVAGLFGPTRQLYKRVAEFNFNDGAEVHRCLARRPYPWLVRYSSILAAQLSSQTSTTFAPTDVLIDAPPIELEVDINIDVIARDGQVRSLGDVSPVASALAENQFDNQVKRVRVYVAPEKRDVLRTKLTGQDWQAILVQAADRVSED